MNCCAGVCHAGTTSGRSGPGRKRKRSGGSSRAGRKKKRVRAGQSTVEGSSKIQNSCLPAYCLCLLQGKEHNSFRLSLLLETSLLGSCFAASGKLSCLMPDA